MDEIIKKIKEFYNTLDDSFDYEWYMTERDIFVLHEDDLINFLKENLDINSIKKNINKKC